jgi:hypothetical protein
LASEQTLLAKSFHKWVTDIADEIVWIDQPSRLSGLQTDDAGHLFCLIVSKILASALTKALCLGSKYQWQQANETKHLGDNWSRVTDTKVNLQLLAFPLEMRKDEIKRSNGPTTIQTSELEQLFRQEFQLKIELVRALAADNGMKASLEQAREKWCAAWLEVDSLLKPAWWTSGILR